MLMEVFLRVIKSLTIMISCMYILTSSSTSRSERIKNPESLYKYTLTFSLAHGNIIPSVKTPNKGPPITPKSASAAYNNMNGVSLRLQVLNLLMYFVTEGIRTLPAALLLRVRPRRLVQGR